MEQCIYMLGRVPLLVANDLAPNMIMSFLRSTLSDPGLTDTFAIVLASVLGN